MIISQLLANNDQTLEAIQMLTNWLIGEKIGSNTYTRILQKQKKQMTNKLR